MNDDFNALIKKVDRTIVIFTILMLIEIILHFIMK